MNLKVFLSLLATAFLVTACASAPPRLNNTAVKTQFDVLTNDQKKEERWVKEDEKFLVRDIRLTSAAQLTEDLTITIGKKEKILKAGTFMFGASVPGPKLDIKILEMVASLKTKSPDLYDKITNPPGTTKKERSDAQKAALTEAVKAHQAEAGYSQFKVFCGLSDHSLNVEEFTSALLTLGLTLSARMDDVYCLQDSNGDGRFDKQWQSNLTYNFPPTINNVYNDHVIQSVSFDEIPRDEIEALGQLWIEIDINRKGTKATINGKIGKGKKAIEFDNLRQKITINGLGATYKFFGASYKVVELDRSGRALISITSASSNQSVSLSKTVTYTRGTRFVPIYIPG